MIIKIRKVEHTRKMRTCSSFGNTYDSKSMTIFSIVAFLLALANQIFGFFQ